LRYGFALSDDQIEPLVKSLPVMAR
jgi:hypothetical protein